MVKKSCFKWIFIILFFSVTIIAFLPRNEAHPYYIPLNADMRLDYYIHFLFYLVLTVLFMKWQQLEGRSQRWLNIIVVIFGSVYASLNEIVQLFVPTRAFNPLDILSNISGVIIGLIFVNFVLKKDHKSQP